MFARRLAGPAGQVEAMYQDRCASCHTSCGTCHISRPSAVKGGLVAGHRFRATPSMVDNCTACHGSRIGAEYRGENSLNGAVIPADAHYRAGKNCMFCHTGTELHGEGTTPDLRYEAPGAPDCLDCHPEAATDSESENPWHSTHGPEASGSKLACQVCHSQPYKNCYQCHVQLDEQGLEFPSRIDFRIGRNAQPEHAGDADYVLVRHIPIAPASFADWGVSLGNYTSEPTWRYATPHNLARRTSVAYPEGYPNTRCSSACHNRDEIRLTTAYLDSLQTQGVLVAEEKLANQHVVVR
jgi:thiosulfate/3-mercaptopyruvate sulfurtransferase